MKSSPFLPIEDLEHILDHTEPLWRELAGQRIFISGGTGFFGIWLLASLSHAQQRLGLDLQAIVLSRRPQTFLQRYPCFGDHRAIRWLKGDVRDFSFPAGEYSHIIHAATDVYARDVSVSLVDAFDTIVNGTRRILEFAHHAGTRNFLLTSSGAVYGQQPTGIQHIPEDFTGAPDSTSADSFYGEGKRAAETISAICHAAYSIDVKIARCFAFVGPGMPLDGHHAIGNFIGDLCNDRPITIRGDGSQIRSYLYASDLIIWLLTILVRGHPMRPYNVGSDRALNLRELAGNIAHLASPALPVVTFQPPDSAHPPSRYVPDIARARAELGLTIRIPLLEAIQRTAAWHRQGHLTQRRHANKGETV